MKKKVLAFVCGLAAALVLSAILVPSESHARGNHGASTFLLDSADGGKDDGALYTDGHDHYCCDEGNARDCADHVRCNFKK